MIIKVAHRRIYGRDLYFAVDDWTKEFFKLLKPSSPQCSLSRRQLQGFREIGFQIELHLTPEAMI